MPSMPVVVCVSFILLGGALGRRFVEELREADLQSVTVRHVSEAEARERRVRSLSLAEAEQLLYGELSRVASSGAASSSTPENKSSAADGPDFEEQVRRFTHAVNQSDKAFAAEQLNTTLGMARPIASGSICVQLDIDLSWVGMPGLSVNLGLMGGVYYHANGCWGVNFEVSLGFHLGFKVLGYGFAVGVSLSGNIDLDEVPPMTALNDPNATVKDLEIHAPANADLSRCYSHSPWVLVQTFLEHEARRVSKMNEVQNAAMDASSGGKLRNKEDECMEKYQDLLNGSFRVLNKTAAPNATGPDTLEAAVVHAPSLVGPAAAMGRAMRLFVGHLPAYAGQVLDRLVDNTIAYHGTDRTWSTGLKRLEQSTGQYWARWPSSERFQHLCDEEHDGCERNAGITRKMEGSDQRVMNFAKAMRFSKHNEKLHFWKELAMSAANLLVRVVGDVKSLFAAAFAEDANWDGGCDSLKTYFTLGKEIRREVFHDHAWASHGYQLKYREDFVAKKADSKKRPHTRLFNGTPFAKASRTGQDLDLFPRLWCALLQHGGSIADEDQVRSVEVSVSQACENVVTVTIELKDDDVIEWNDTARHYTVLRNGERVGFLSSKQGMEVSCRDCRNSSDQNKSFGKLRNAAHGENYMVSYKEIQTRAECEEAVLPPPFVRLFPSFVRTVIDYRNVLESILADINECIEEVGFRHKRDVLIKPAGCDTDEGKLKYITRRSKEAIRTVRRFLLSLGAEDPRLGSSYTEGHVPLSEEELEVIEQAEGGDFAPTARALAADYALAFGEEPAADTAKMSARAAEHGTLVPELLNGHLWQYLPDVGPWLLYVANPLIRMMDKPLYKHRPPLQFTRALVLTFQTDTNGFCTPNTGFLMVQDVARTTGRTWSPVVFSEHCRIGRIRPGDVFVQLLRCVGYSNSKDQKQKQGQYVDWRIRFQMVMIKASLVSGMKGAMGQVLSGIGTTGLLSAATITGATVAGGLMTTSLIDRFAPIVHNSPISRTLLFLSGTAGPLLGAIAGGAAAAGVSQASFTSICKVFLQSLASNGIISTAAPDAPPTELLGFSANGQIVMWGSVVYREKHVKVKNGSRKARTIRKFQRVMAMHIENWNRVEVSVGLPALGRATVYGKLDLDWDLTDWLVAMSDRRRFEENKQRQQRCAKCLQDGMAFCDWKYTFGTAWTPEMDACQNATQDSRAYCKRDLGFTDDFGVPLPAAYFAPEHGVESCSEIDFHRTNQEFRVTERMRRFLRRH